MACRRLEHIVHRRKVLLLRAHEVHSARRIHNEVMKSDASFGCAEPPWLRHLKCRLASHAEKRRARAPDLAAELAVR
jgi:hypothetical protein